VLQNNNGQCDEPEKNDNENAYIFGLPQSRPNKILFIVDC
jgi:hypothetical protein